MTGDPKEGRGVQTREKPGDADGVCSTRRQAEQGVERYGGGGGQEECGRRGLLHSTRNAEYHTNKKYERTL